MDPLVADLQDTAHTEGIDRLDKCAEHSHFENSISLLAISHLLGQARSESLSLRSLLCLLGNHTPMNTTGRGKGILLHRTGSG